MINLQNLELDDDLNNNQQKFNIKKYAVTNLYLCKH